MSYVLARQPRMLGALGMSEGAWLVGAGVIALAILGMSFGGGGRIERNPRRRKARRKTSRRSPSLAPKSWRRRAKRTLAQRRRRLASRGLSWSRNRRRTRKTSRRSRTHARRLARNSRDALYGRKTPGKWAVSWRLGGKDHVRYFEQRRPAERWHDFLVRTQSNASNIQLFDAGLIHEMFGKNTSRRRRRSRRRSRRTVKLHRRRRYTSLLGR